MGTVEDLIVDELREKIVTGSVAPGTRLPIRDLANQMGVSVTPIRIALKQLAGEGLVKLTPHVGATVSPLTLEELEELLVTRYGIESWLAFTGADALSDPEIGEMVDGLAELARAVKSRNATEYLGLSWSLRVPCYRAAKRPHMLGTATDLFRRSQRYHLLNLADKERIEWSYDLFRRFVDACRERDGVQARNITRQGFEWTLDYLARATQGRMN